MTEALVARDLERAASYRFLALLFATPSDEVGRELAELADVVAPSLREDATLVSQATKRSLQGLYYRVLGGSGQVPDVECAYDANTAAGRGPLIADVAGFYKAFAYDAPPPNTADHIANELDFMGWLAMKSAYAHHAGEAEHAEITANARAKFLKDHLGRWAKRFFERLAEVAEGTHYEAVAVLASRTLEQLEGPEVFERPTSRTRLPVIDEPEGEDSCG